MPGKHAKRPRTTNLLVQVPNDVHAAADVRRRRENTTWRSVVTELLRRWAQGDDAALTRHVRAGRPATPDAAEMQRLVDEWMKDPAYRKAATERVDISKLVRYRSPAELFAAHASRAGRSVPAEAFAELDDQEVDHG